MNIVHTQVRSVVGALYRVVDTVTSASGIDTRVFVFRTTDDEYRSVATVDDMLTLPVDKLSPEAVTLGYYRAVIVTKDMDNLNDATDFGEIIQVSLKALVVEYNRAVTAFIGTTTETLSS